MRLLTLDLENWGCHSNLHLDLANGLQIEGRNGSGKTSILEAIKFIFAESALGFKNRVKNGSRMASVSLTFMKDNNRYLIEKQLYVDKPSTARMLCNETVVGDNPTNVYKAMQNIVDENIFEKLLYIPQGGLTSIVESLSRKEGRKELDSLFGLEKFDRVYRESAEDLKEARLKYDFISEQQAKHPKDATIQYVNELKKLESEKKTIEEEVGKLRDELAALESRTSKIALEVKALEDSKKSIDKLKEELKNLEVEYARTSAESEAVKQRIEGMSKIAIDFKTLTSRGAELKKYAEIRETLGKLEKLRDRQKQMNPDKDREKLSVLKTDLAGKQEAEKSYNEAEESSRKKESIKAGLEQELKIQENRQKELEGLDGKATCPRCGQPLTPSHLGKEREDSSASISRVKSQLTEVNADLGKALEEKKQLKEKLSRLEKTEAEAKYIESELQKKIDEEKMLSEAVVHLKEQLYASGYRDEDAGSIDQKVAEFNKISGELERLGGELKQKEELEEKGKKLSDALVRIVSQKVDKNGLLGQITFREEDLSRLRQEKEDFTQKRYSTENDVNKKQFRLTEIKTKQEEFNSKQEECEKLIKQKESQEQEIRLLTQAREVFHTDKGIQKYLRDRYISQLNNLLTYYFKRLNENSKYTEIAFDKDYEIRIKTTEGSMAIEQLSGGEKIQLAIALRIALTDILSHTRLLILDEPFGILDRNHREILGEALSKMAANGQLIVVTHVHVDSLQLDSIGLEGY